MASFKLVLLFVCVLFGIIYQVESAEVLDKIRGGLNVAYNEVHCGFHKLKELVKHHEHDVDPCSKPLATTEKPQVDGNTESSQIYNNEGRPIQENTYGWRV